MSRVRLDKALVEREISRSRSQAKELIESGEVLVNGMPVSNPASLVDADDTISLVTPERADWVGRGGRKIAPLLEDDWLDVADCVCLDVGSSTGGFTQALLLSEASHVHAVDAGEGQLAYELRQDERVSIHEKYNFRYADSVDFSPDASRFVMDVSFISTLKLIKALNDVLSPDAFGLVLVKPQFEAGPDENNEGIVRDLETITRVLDDVIEGWSQMNWGSDAIRPSPLEGNSGNQEYFVRFSRGSQRRLSTSVIKDAVRNGTIYRPEDTK